MEPETPHQRRETPEQRRVRVHEALASTYDGVVQRRHLRDLGLTWSQIRAEIDAGRWHRWGRTTVSLTGEQISLQAFRWHAVWETGPRAVLDGATALLAHGLTSWTEDLQHVSVPKGARSRTTVGVRVHELRWLGPVTTKGVPATVPELAAIRAAQWARSERAAVTVLTMAVQQRVAQPARISRLWNELERPTRRSLLDEVVPLICHGVQALGEYDFARLCRSRGLPEPQRQEVVTSGDGRVYLDVYWRRYGVHAEINGAQHYRGLAPVQDALRQNDRALGDDVSLQIPVLGLVTDAARFLDQVEHALRRKGWRP